MAQLPADRTKLNAAVQNQQPSFIADAIANREALIEAYDTIDMLYNFTAGLVAGGKLQPYPHGLYRNAIINGNFDVWQRGTSFTSSGYTADRWVIADDGGTPSYTVTQESFTPGQTAVPGEPRYFTKISVSATSVGAIVFGQRVEDVRTFAGQKATLSFYARADVPTTGSQVTSAMFQIFGTGGSAQVGVLEYPIALTTSWQRYSVTFNVPSIAGKIIGQNSMLYVQPIRISSSAPLTNYYIAQVQLCAGDVALPYQPRSFAEELVLCQRYYEKSYDLDIAPGSTNTNGMIQFNSGVPTTNPIYIPVQFKVAKRIAPTVTLYDGAGAPGMVYKGANGKTASLSRVGVSGFVGGTADSTNSSDLVFHYTADAEL